MCPAKAKEYRVKLKDAFVLAATSGWSLYNVWPSAALCMKV